MKNTFYKILGLGLLFVALGTGFSLRADEEVLLPDESTEEVLVSKALDIEEPVVLEESVFEELVKKSLEIEESVVEELDADKLVEQLVEMVNEYNKASRPDAPTEYSPGTVVGPDCDLTPIMNLLGTIISRIGLVTDKTSLKKTVLGILGDPNSVLGTDYTVVQALKEILDFLDTDHVITKADTPYIISTPGKYTVIEYIDKSFTGTFAILINCDDVELNLNGYTITNTSTSDALTYGVVINPTFRNHVIKDGALIGFGIGLYVNDTLGNLKVLSVTFKDNTLWGMSVQGSPIISNILIQDCICDFNSEGALFTNYENLVIRNSTFNTNTGLAPLTEVRGLELVGTSSSAIIENCTANENTSSSTGATVICEGFAALGGDATFLCCEASFNGNSDNSNLGRGFRLEDDQYILKDCVANGNYSVLYDVAATGGRGIHIVNVDSFLVGNCVCNNNRQMGIFVDGSRRGHIENCQFINNGQFGIDLTSTSSFVHVMSNKFISNGSLAVVAGAINLLDAGTNNVFMSNTAFIDPAATPAPSYVNYDASTAINPGLSPSIWILSVGAPVPTWPIDNLDIRP